MPTLFSDADIGLDTAKPAAPSPGLLSDAAVGLSSAPQATEQKVPGQISIPLPGGGSFTPSLIGMVKGLLNAGVDAATLPGDVYAGKLDPLSDEGIGRSANLATMTALPSAGRTLARPAVNASVASELKDAARPTFQELTGVGNTIAVEGKPIAQGIAEELHPQAL